MIILDTNVLSELMRGEAHGSAAVFTWVRSLDEQPVTTVINRAELLAGVGLLPAGMRQDRLAAVVGATLDRLGVCLSLVPECAAIYAAVVARRRRVGRPVGAMDALIGSIAVVSDASIATRDVDGFADMGVQLIDPWSSPEH